MAQKLSGILGKTIEYSPMVLYHILFRQNWVVWSIWRIYSDWGITKLVSWDKKVAQGVALKKDLNFLGWWLFYAHFFMFNKLNILRMILRIL